MEIAELDCYVNELLSKSVIDEGYSLEPQFPTNEQRDVFTKIEPKILQLKILMRKYYAIEPNPTETAGNLSKLSLSFCTFEGDRFAKIKNLLHKLNKLKYLSEDGNYLMFREHGLWSSKENRFDQSIFFDNQTSFTGVSVAFGQHMRAIEKDLRQMIT